MDYKVNTCLEDVVYHIVDDTVFLHNFNLKLHFLKIKGIFNLYYGKTIVQFILFFLYLSNTPNILGHFNLHLPQATFQ